MSIVLAVKDIDSVHLVADSCFVDGDVIYLDSKIVQCGRLAIGVAGNAEILSILTDFCERNETRINKSLASTKRSFKSWVFHTFYGELGENLGASSLLVACPTDFCTLDGDGVCLTDVRGYSAIGSGSVAALAAMGCALLQHADTNKKSLRLIAEEAVFEACSYMTTCEPPVEVLTLETL